MPIIIPHVIFILFILVTLNHYTCIVYDIHRISIADPIEAQNWIVSLPVLQVFGDPHKFIVIVIV